MFTAFINACKLFINRVTEQVKKITKPATATLAAGALSDLPRSKSVLIVENAILRQQLIVLKRSVKRPKFTVGDRVRLTLLARLTGFWQSASGSWFHKYFPRSFRSFKLAEWPKQTKI